MKRLLISGYYGFNNIGDEAVLGGMLAGLRAALPDVEPVVLSANPTLTTQQHAVAAIPRMSRTALRAELCHAALLISGGGSLLQDVTSFRSPLYYLWVLWEAQRMGIPTMMCAQGVGPLRHPLTRFLTRNVLNGMRAITVRDGGSASYLHALGVQRPPIEVTADLSFLQPPHASPRLADWWTANIPANRPLLGVALRPWPAGPTPERYTAIADALAAVAAQTGALLLFLPMQYGTDRALADEMSGWTPAENRVLPLELTPREMLAAVGRCDLLLAMRLHALIFAVHQGVPAAGIAYDPKVRDFCLAAQLPAPLAWDDLRTDTLATTLQTQWTTRAALHATLTTSASQLTTLARRNITRVQELLG
jgi:polysaccharide pyruvyl transferase CsaB